MKKNFIRSVSFVTAVTFLGVMSSYSLVFAQQEPYKIDKTLGQVSVSATADSTKIVQPATVNQSKLKAPVSGSDKKPTPTGTDKKNDPTGTDGTPSKNNTVSSIKLKNPLKPGLDTIPKIINAILDGIVIPIAVPIFILAIIWTGIRYVIARGKPDEINKAHETLKWTLIGGAVILGAKLISSAIAGTLAAITGTVVK